MFRSIFFFATLFLLFFVGNLYATSYYVSTASSGTASADSWTNKKIITSLDWTQLHGGDTVFVDGGTSGTTYNFIRIDGITPSSTVVITKGKETSHNGVVYFSPSGGYSSNYCALRVSNSSHLKITNMTFNWGFSAVSDGGVLEITNSSSYIQLDSCHFISNGYSNVVWVATSTYVSLTNNLIESLSNAINSDQDIIDFVEDGGGHTITGNTIIARGTNATPHIDLIQYSGIGSTNYYLTTIANNFFYAVRNSSIANNQGIFFDSHSSHRFLIYNNIIAINTPTTVSLSIRQYSPYHVSMQIYNNTLISKSHYAFYSLNLDSVVFKNNMRVVDSANGTISVVAPQGVGYRNFDFNQYFQRNHAVRIDTGSTAFDFGTWKALGYDANSDTGIVNFANIWGTNASDYMLSTGSAGIGAGVDLSTFFTTDILGTTRPQGSAWDKGAFQTSVSSNNSYYYVANNGNDANSGTSTSSPWKTISKVNSKSFNPGDNILFRRGDTWPEILTPQGSGNASKPITYDAYGSGNLPIIDGGTINNNCISLIGVNYITIRNFRVQYAAVNTNGDIHAQYTDHLRIENCDCYITSHGGVFVESSTNTYLGNCTMSSPVSNNDNQADGIYSQRNSNCIYENNSIVISDMGTAHNDGIHSYLDTNMTLRNNYIYQNNSLTLAQGIDMSDGAGTFYVYNNVVKCPNSTSNIIGFNNDVSGTGALRCYQNTVLGNVNCLRILKCADVTVKNNIFYSNSATSIIDIGTTLNSGSEIDYNLYNRRGSGSMVLYEPQGYMTYTQWKAAGYETHGLNSNPIVNDTLCPAINSPVVNAGTNLGGIYSYDKEGTLRPMNGVDLGAYELKSSTVPVEFTSFSGLYINNSVRLIWSMATEINNQGFDIERNNNSSWEKIGFIEGKGNSTTKNNYSFEDKNPIGYTLQYRLKQIDNNGNFKYSTVVEITAIQKDFSIGNYPNPFNPSTKIRYSVTSESMINLVIYNIIGERIDELKNETQHLGTYEINWNGGGHPSGIYFLSIVESPINRSAKNSKTIKMNLIK